MEDKTAIVESQIFPAKRVALRGGLLVFIPDDKSKDIYVVKKDTYVNYEIGS